MDDKGVFDDLPDILVTWNLKHEISRAQPTSSWVRKHLPLKDPTPEIVDKGVFDDLPDITGTWNLKNGISSTCSIHPECVVCQEPPVLQGYPEWDPLDSKRVFHLLSIIWYKTYTYTTYHSIISIVSYNEDTFCFINFIVSNLLIRKWEGRICN